ncbi:AAA family ATPase [Curtobacterium poinsettiae]|uniref:AAA family ATPase n=1 Tax=Curtobacterium TaxID=2034 RepID=UPI00217DAD1F|nr:helicase RepA family protein [Curtobacterium flaccumfaciens]MCS6563438.1 helicase RepA family protein [Curtobacterium flaccumfaciens pv. poinsettiae]UXN27234.1 helicase RepA family protein [Curtobacterium flaccumfaciens]
MSGTWLFTELVRIADDESESAYVREGARQRAALMAAQTTDAMSADVERRTQALRAQQEAERLVNATHVPGRGLLTWEDMEDDADVEWFVPHMIPAGATTNMIVGRRNLGKTALYLGACVSVAAGIDFLGSPTRQGTVLFILGEGRQGFMQRVYAYALDNGIDPDTLRDKLHFYDGGSINNDASLDSMADAIADIRPDIVVVDTYSMVAGSADEDKAALANMTLARMRSAAPDSAVLYIHHPRKSDENTEKPVTRGSGALDGAMDVLGTLFVDTKYKPKSGEAQQWLAYSTEGDHGGKNRHGELTTIRGIYLENVSHEHNGKTYEAVVVRQDTSGDMSKGEEWVRKNLTTGLAVTVASLVESTGVVRATIQRYLNEAPNVDVEKGSGSNPHVYTRKF